MVPYKLHRKQSLFTYATFSDILSNFSAMFSVGYEINCYVQCRLILVLQVQRVLNLIQSDSITSNIEQISASETLPL